MLDDPAAPAPKDRRPLLNRPDLKPAERRRIGRVVAILLGWGLAATALLAVLALWHLVRRGRVLRASLPEPRPVSLPEPDPAPE